MFKHNRELNLIYWGIGILITLILFSFFAELTPVFGAIFSFVIKVLAPFMMSCLIAYLLSPVIRELNHFGLPKWLAILSIYLLFFGVTGYLIYWGYPMFLRQLRDLSEQLPELTKSYSELIYNVYDSTSFLPEAVHDKIDDIISQLEAYLDTVLSKVASILMRVSDIIVFVTVVPVLVFYLLKDYEKINSYSMSWLSESARTKVQEVLAAIDDSLGNYIRGVFFVSLFVGFVSFLLFHILNVPYPLLLAIILGITNIIPYFGPIIGAIPAVALAATLSSKTVIIVLLSLFALQLVESNLVSPYIMGKSVRIHPIVIIFALLLGGQIAGIAGMILSVPILTVLRGIAPPLLELRRIR